MFEIYKNKNVLITGHTGFKGSWLTTWLLKLGANITGYGLDPKNEKDNFVLSNLSEKINDYRLDIRDFSKLNEIIKIEKPEIIFHLAAQPLVLESYKNPHYTIETNTQGTANILESFRKSKTAKVLIVITTDKVYKNKEWDWGYREIDELGGNDPYSASKAASEILISSYQKSYFYNFKKNLASVRAGNVIGGGDWSENRIIPDCIRSIEKNKNILIRNPYSTRPWQHVLEPLAGYLLLGEKLLEGKTYSNLAFNFGPNISNVINVENLVEKVMKIYGNGNSEIQRNDNKLNESKYLSLDISKTIKTLNWKPILTLDETIEFTINWYKNYKDSNIYLFCNKQIEDFVELCKLRN